MAGFHVRRRRVRLGLVGILLAVTILLGSGVHLLHGYQVRRNSDTFVRLANEAEKSGDKAKAADYLRRYVALNPDDIAQLARLELMRADLADTPRAKLQATFRLAAVLRKAPDRLDVRRKRAELLLEIGRYADALEQLQVLIEVIPDDPELYRMLAEAHAGRGNYEAAVLACRKVLELDPKDFDTYELLLALLRDRLERREEAEKVVEELLQHHGQDPRALVVAARHYRAAGDLTTARKHADAALQAAPDNADAIVLAATIALEQEDYDVALDLAQRGIEKAHDNPEPYILAARVLASRDRMAEAIAVLRKGLEATDRSPIVLVTLAEYLATSGREDDAERLLKGVKPDELAPENVDLIQGLLALRRGSVLEAAEKLEQAVVRSARVPSLQVRALYYLAQAYRMMGLTDLALQNIRAATNLQPQAAYLRWLSAELHAAQGQIAEALGEARLAARLGSMRPEHAALLLRLYVLEQLVRPEPQRVWRQVDTIAGTLHERFPDAPPMVIAYADYLRIRGRATEALELLNQAIEKNPGEETLFVALADHYRRWNLPDKAEEILDKGVEACGDTVSFRLARLSLATSKDDLAKRLERALEGSERFEQGDRSRLLRTLAIGYASLGDNARASELLEKACQISPHDLGARVLLFDVALREGDTSVLKRVVSEMRRIESRGVFGREGAIWKYGQALILLMDLEKNPDDNRVRQARLLLEQAKTERPNWSKPYAILARIYEATGDLALASDAYATAVRLGERNAETVAGALRTLIRQGRVREADDLLRSLYAEQAIPPEVQLTASTLFARNQDIQSALDLARKHVEQNPDDALGHAWYARLLEANGDSETALTHLRKACELAPENPQVWVALVAYYARNDRRQEAERVIEEEVKKRLTGDALAACLAACYEALGEQDRARKSMQELLARHESNAAVLAAAAEFYIRQREYDEAEQLLRKAIRLETETQGSASEKQETLQVLRRRLAFLLASRGGYARWQEAYNLIEQNLKADRESRDDLRVKAILLASRNSARLQKEAIKLFEQLLESGSLTPQERFILGQLYYRYGQPQRGREQILRALAEEPDNPRFVAEYAELLLRRGELGDAASWVSRLEELEPDRHRTADLKIRLYQAQGNTEAALQVAKKLEQKYMNGPNGEPNTVGLALLGRLYEAIGHPEEAGRMYREVAARVPEGLLLLAEWLADQDQVEKAMEVVQQCWEKLPPERAVLAVVKLARHPRIRPEHRSQFNRQVEEAISRSPGKVDLWVAAALLKDAERDYETAAKLYREVLAVDPDNVVALNNLAWLLSEYFEQPQQALPLIDRAIERVGPVPELLDTRGVILFRLGKIQGPDSALELLQEAYDTAPAPHIGFHLARVYAELGRVADARLLLEQLGPPETVERDLHGAEVADYHKLLATVRAFENTGR